MHTHTHTHARTYTHTYTHTHSHTLCIYMLQRADDTSEALKKRMSSYHAETIPVLNHYSSVVHVRLCS
jgi:adenylate kinase family enzyme